MCLFSLNFLITSCILQENELRQEILQIHDYECEICASVFNSMFDYLDHQEIHNGQAVFQCHRCVQVSKSTDAVLGILYRAVTGACYCLAVKGGGLR